MPHPHSGGTTFRGAQSDLTETALGALQGAQTLGGQAESEFFQRSLAFDPQQGALESSRAIAGDLSDILGRNLESARGQAVGSGRLDTGFFDIDRGRLFEDFNTRLSRAIAENSLRAQSLQLGNIQGIGNFAGNVQNRFVNLLGGSLDRATAERNAEEEQKRRRGGLFGRIAGGIIGGIGGFLPVGRVASGIQGAVSGFGGGGG